MKLRETWGYKNETKEAITDQTAIKGNIYFLDAFMASDTFYNLLGYKS